MRILGLVIAAALLAGSAEAAEEKRFENWVATCNNVRVCVALGLRADDVNSDNDGTVAGYLRIDRDAAGAATPNAAIVVESTDEARATTFSVQVDGVPVNGLGSLRAHFWEEHERADLTPSQTAALIAAIRTGASLTVLEGSRVISRISLRGAPAALLWVDEQQQRLNTTTALIRTGRAAPATVPSPPAAPLVAPAPPASQLLLPSLNANALLSQVESCDEDIRAAGFAPTVARLGSDAILVAVACSRSAYNVSSAIFITNGQGRAPRRIVPPPPPANDPVNDDLPMNVTFDPRTQTLTSFYKLRGLGDCGAFTTWIWTGRAFVLSRQEVMGACEGVTLADWPNLYDTRRR